MLPCHQVCLLALSSQLRGARWSLHAWYCHVVRSFRHHHTTLPLSGRHRPQKGVAAAAETERSESYLGRRRGRALASLQVFPCMHADPKEGWGAGGASTHPGASSSLTLEAQRMCEQVDESKLLNKVKKTDKREKPKYDLRYRQKINSDDALGLSLARALSLSLSLSLSFSLSLHFPLSSLPPSPALSLPRTLCSRPEFHHRTRPSLGVIQML